MGTTAANHVDLAVTGEITDVIAHAQQNADLVAIFGAAGASKTWSARRYCHEHADAWLVTMSPAVTTPSAALARIARTLNGGIAVAETTAARLEQAVIARLSVGGVLLIVDEAHHLNHMLLDVVRCVQDAAGCGVALVGNEPLWARLAGGDRAAQLCSRVGIRLYLQPPAEADALTLAGTLLGRAPEDAGRRAVLVAGRGMGGLRAVSKLVTQARILARGDGRDAVSDRDLADAAALLGS